MISSDENEIVPFLIYGPTQNGKSSFVNYFLKKYHGQKKAEEGDGTGISTTNMDLYLLDTQGINDTSTGLKDPLIPFKKLIQYFVESSTILTKFKGIIYIQSAGESAIQIESVIEHLSVILGIEAKDLKPSIIVIFTKWDEIALKKQKSFFQNGIGKSVIDFGYNYLTWNNKINEGDGNDDIESQKEKTLQENDLYKKFSTINGFAPPKLVKLNIEIEEKIKKIRKEVIEEYWVDESGVEINEKYLTVEKKVLTEKFEYLHSENISGWAISLKKNHICSDKKYKNIALPLISVAKNLKIDDVQKTIINSVNVLTKNCLVSLKGNSLEFESEIEFSYKIHKNAQIKWVIEVVYSYEVQYYDGVAGKFAKKYRPALTYEEAKFQAISEILIKQLNI